MVNKVNFKSILSIAKNEYINWITNPRIIIIGIFFVFMYTLAIEPLLERAEKTGECINAFEPFIAIGNSGMLVLLIPCLFLMLVSDYPVISGNTIFFIHRTGKVNWFLGQILFVLFSITFIILSILTVSMLLSNGSFSIEWSETIRKYNSMFPNESGNFASQLIPSNLYNQIPLTKAVIETILLLFEYLFVLALILYAFKLRHIQSVGLFIVFTIVGLGVTTCSLKTTSMWIFPMANTIVWLHYSEILQKPIFPVWFSFLYFGILILILLFTNFFALEKMQFINIEL